MEFVELLALLKTFGGLLGVAALVTVLINIGKIFKVVKDGTADKWNQGAQLLIALILFIWGLVSPDTLDLGKVDAFAQEVADLGILIVPIIPILIKWGTAVYGWIKGLPILGYSNTK